MIIDLNAHILRMNSFIFAVNCEQLQSMATLNNNNILAGTSHDFSARIFPRWSLPPTRVQELADDEHGAVVAGARLVGVESAAKGRV